MSYNISILIFYKIRLPIIISFLIVYLCIVSSNFVISKIFSCLYMCFCAEVKSKSAIILNEILPSSACHLIDKLLPNHIQNSFTQMVRTIDIFAFFFQGFESFKFCFEFGLQRLLKIVQIKFVSCEFYCGIYSLLIF